MAVKSREVFESRLRLVTAQLARSPYLAGEAFTAADISVTYALELGQRNHVGVALGEAEQAYVACTTSRDAYARAVEKSQSARGAAVSCDRPVARGLAGFLAPTAQAMWHNRRHD